jgi:zinc protease
MEMKKIRFNKRINDLAVLILLLFFVFFGVRQMIWGTSDRAKNFTEKITVKDNFSFIYQQDPRSEITVIHILIKGGLLSVPLTKRGTAFITNRLAVELPSTDDLQALMHLGSNMSAQVTSDYTTITIKSLSLHLEASLKIVAKVIKKPLFSSLRMGNLKRFMEHRQKSVEDVPEQMMVQTFLAAISKEGDYGYGGSMFGDKSSRKAIKRKDTLDYYKQFFNHANMIITVSSDLEKDKLTAIIKKYFSSLGLGQPSPKIQPKISLPEERKVFFKKDNQQVLIAFAYLLPGIDKQNYASIYLLENLLGKGIGSKIWALRSQENLTYSVNSQLLRMKDAGLLIVYLKADNNKKEQAYQTLKTLLTNFQIKGASVEELQITKVFSRGEFLRNNETKEQRSRQLAYFETMGMGFAYLDHFLAEIEKVTLSDLNEYIRRLFDPSRMMELTIGPMNYPQAGDISQE